MKSLLSTPIFALLLSSCTFAQDQKATKPFLSFESEAEITSAKLNNTSAVLVETNVSDGKKALAVTFKPPASYPNFAFPIATPLDWSGFGGLAFEVSNPGAEAVSFALRIDSAAGSDGSKNSRTGAARIEAGQTVSLLMPFDVEAESPDMSAIPGFKLMNKASGWNLFNLKNIAAMQIFSAKPLAEKTLVFDNLRLVPALPPVAAPPLKTETKTLLSFETDAEKSLPKGNNARFEAVSTGATLGQTALKLTLDPPATYPNVGFPFASPQDLRGYGGLAFDLKNPTDELVRFFVRIDSSKSAGGTGQGARSGSNSLEAGQSGTFVLPFGIDASALGMRSLPGFGEFRSLGAGGEGQFDLSSVATWQIFLVRPTRPTELILDNVRLVPGQKQDFNGIIDNFGQYTRADWPGKIKSNVDFAGQTAREDADLKANPAPAQWNKYGGWANGPQLKASGFFRTEKYNGKWSFVDPEGRLFLSFGPTTIGTNQTTPTTGREFLFAGQADADPILAKFQGEKKDSLDFLGANLERKYGKNWRPIWAKISAQRLKNWGFNTVGNWSSDDLKSQSRAPRLPYVATAGIYGDHARLSDGEDYWGQMHDPFDSQFAEDARRALNEIAAKIKSDPYCVGYFVENELGWGNGQSANPKLYFGLVYGVLNLPSSAPAKSALLAGLRQKYGSIEKLNAAWNMKLPNWETLEPPFVVGELTSEMRADFSGFLGALADKYFAVVAAQLKSVAPRHLYLGARFSGRPPLEVAKASARNCDVVSFNIYAPQIDAKEWAFLSDLGKPSIIGEFHIGALDRGMFAPGLVAAKNQTERAQMFKKYVQSVLSNPNLVGCHWFQYADQPVTGRSQDGENYNIGFVDITDTPYAEMVAAAREVNASIYSRRSAKK